ncbi:putative uncharacterized protein DDB_G0290521 [Penaeus monodon]|uniref:putative uncharacterized protein DDB_G0290521 n=1 Tax=Penaeus monodon TaxID=6687 RepID=UPI0018A7852C|nr:putative uncharacterized protein DDB_G0290521 [Penaeus monodon]
MGSVVVWNEKWRRFSLSLGAVNGPFHPRNPKSSGGHPKPSFCQTGGKSLVYANSTSPTPNPPPHPSPRWTTIRWGSRAQASGVTRVYEKLSWASHVRDIGPTPSPLNTPAPLINLGAEAVCHPRQTPIWVPPQSAPTSRAPQAPQPKIVPLRARADRYIGGTIPTSPTQTKEH